MVDVDNFKSYNDIYGHQAGDAALVAIATTLAREVRKADAVYRFGGEEFLLVLQDQSPATAAWSWNVSGPQSMTCGSSTPEIPMVS